MLNKTNIVLGGIVASAFLVSSDLLNSSIWVFAALVFVCYLFTFVKNKKIKTFNKIIVAAIVLQGLSINREGIRLINKSTFPFELTRTFNIYELSKKHPNKTIRNNRAGLFKIQHLIKGKDVKFINNIQADKSSSSIKGIFEYLGSVKSFSIIVGEKKNCTPIEQFKLLGCDISLCKKSYLILNKCEVTE